MTAFDMLMIALFGLSLLRWSVTLVVAIADHQAGSKRSSRKPLATQHAPLTSAIVPAYNEETLIDGTLRSLAASDYPHLEILLVDDGSTDSTRAIAQALMAEIPNLRLIAQELNEGKAAALNAGVRAAKGELIITVDADTRVHPRAVGRLVQTLVTSGAAAAAGNIKVGNRKNWLTGWQALEYVVGLQLERRAQARLGCITTVPGALGAFSKDALLRVGLFSSDTLAEDTDLTLALQQGGAIIVFEPRAQAWTEAPEQPRGLLRQRTRWLHGNLHCALKHRAAFVVQGKLALKLYALPSFWFGHLVTPLLLPLTALYLFRLLEWFSWPALLLGMGALLTVDLLTAAVGVIMDRESAGLLPFVPVQRLLFPFFLWVAFVLVCWRVLRNLGRRLPRAGWTPVERRGGWCMPVGPATSPGATNKIVD